jgi:hypothetical protein
LFSSFWVVGLGGVGGLFGGVFFAGAAPAPPDALLWIGDPHAQPDIESLRAAMRDATWHGRANRLSEAHVEWPDIDAIHRATLKP